VIRSPSLIGETLSSRSEVKSRKQSGPPWRRLQMKGMKSENPKKRTLCLNSRDSRGEDAGLKKKGRGMDSRKSGKCRGKKKEKKSI